MKNRTVKWATAAGAVAVLMLSSGCVRIQDVEMLQAEVDALKGELAAAQDAAAGAMSEAAAARAAAGDAASAADGAMNAAGEAQAGSAANAEKIDRMFEKVMMK
jgi:uncharacterized phage infection (PIP) family protein YhgE